MSVTGDITKVVAPILGIGLALVFLLYVIGLFAPSLKDAINKALGSATGGATKAGIDAAQSSANGFGNAVVEEFAQGAGLSADEAKKFDLPTFGSIPLFIDGVKAWLSGDGTGTVQTGTGANVDDYDESAGPLTVIQGTPLGGQQ